METGLLRLSFKGYSPPNGKFQIIVKALPVAVDIKRMVTVNFSAFRKDNIELRVAFNNNQIPSATEIAAMEFMIEISKFFSA